MADVMIKHSTAYLLKCFVDDVANIDDRARCSDATFRRHFLDRIKLLKAQDCFNELDAALKAADAKDEEEQAKPTKAAKKGK